LIVKDLLAERTEGLTDPDDAPAAPEHPVSQTGDLWLLGKHPRSPNPVSDKSKPPSFNSPSSSRSSSGSQPDPVIDSLADYAIPTAGEVPAIKTVHLDAASPSTVGGFRGMGEGGTIGAPAAIANALADALAPLGAEIFELPMTSERLFRLIEMVIRAGHRAHHAELVRLKRHSRPIRSKRSTPSAATAAGGMSATSCAVQTATRQARSRRRRGPQARARR
jgi:hypothetical protein